jgi:hypothetical protein
MIKYKSRIKNLLDILFRHLDFFKDRKKEKDIRLLLTL